MMWGLSRERSDPPIQVAVFKGLLRRFTVSRVKWKAFGPCLFLMLTLVCLPRSIATTRLIFDGPGGSGTAAIISPLEKWEPTGNVDYASVLEAAGYSVETILNDAASPAFFKTELANYDIIILRLDSFLYEGFSYFCTGVTVGATDAQQRNDFATQYATEITAHEISLKGPCVGFSMLYILHSYQKSSFRGLVLALGPGTPELAAAFINNGAAAFITYDSPVEYSLQWGRYDLYTVTILSILTEGYTVRNAVAEFYNQAMRGHGVTADWPSIYWVGDGNYTI
jgi:hypothetical protein